MDCVEVQRATERRTCVSPGLQRVDDRISLTQHVLLINPVVVFRGVVEHQDVHRALSPKTPAVKQARLVSGWDRMPELVTPRCKAELTIRRISSR